MDTHDEFPIDLNLYPSDTQPPSSSGPFLFGYWLPPPPPSPLILPDTQLSCPFPFLYDYELPSPLSPSLMLLPDTPSSGPFLFGYWLPPPSSPLILPDTQLSCPFPFLYDSELPSPLSPSPMLLPDTPSSGPFLFSSLVPPPPPLLLPDTPSSGSFIFSASVPRRNEEEEWRSNQAMWNAEEERWSYLSNLQASQRQEPRRNAEEERWMSSIQRQESRRNEEERSSQVPSLGQSTLTERQILEALDKLKNQVYTGEACVICLEYFVPKEEVSVTPCNHMFHKKCLVPWVMQKGQCPHCRFVLFKATRNQW